MTAHVSLVLNSVTYCVKGERVQVANVSKKHTIFERLYKRKNQEGNEIIDSIKFKVANYLVSLYFK